MLTAKANLSPPLNVKTLKGSILKLILTSVFKGENGCVCEASYKVSYSITCCGEAHMFMENLIIPCIKDIVLCAC
jgi:hypothetical protein